MREWVCRPLHRVGPPEVLTVFETGCTGFLFGRCSEQYPGMSQEKINLKSGVNLFPGAGGVPWKRGAGPCGPGEHTPPL